MTECEKETNSDIDDEEELTCKVRQTIKDSIFFAAKDGLSIALHSLLSNFDNVRLKNAIINQVINYSIKSVIKLYLYKTKKFVNSIISYV